LEKLKQATDLSLEELLQSVEETKENPEELLDLDDVSSFFAVWKIKPGKHKVKKPFLYEFYKQWSKDPLGPYKFAARARDFFEHNASYYFLDKKAFDIVDKIRQVAKSVKHDFTKSTRYKNHLEYFFAANRVTPGDFYFPASILAILYKTWCKKNHFKAALKGWRFDHMCKTYFKNKVTEDGLMLRIDTSILSYLSKEQLEKVNNGNYGSSKEKE